MDFHGQYDGFSMYGHVVPWKTYGYDHGFPWNTSNHGFPILMSLPCYFLWISMVFPWAFYMDLFLWLFSFKVLVVQSF